MRKAATGHRGAGIAGDTSSERFSGFVAHRAAGGRSRSFYADTPAQIGENMSSNLQSYSPPVVHRSARFLTIPRPIHTAGRKKMT